MEDTYYCGDVRCVRVGPNDGVYTANRIYHIEQGKITSDTGEILPNLRGGAELRFRTFKEFAEWSTAGWQEICETEQDDTKIEFDYGMIDDFERLITL